MAFLNRLTSPLATPSEAALGMAVAMLTMDGDLIDVERRVISLFRDQFPPLGDLEESAFQQAFDKATQVVSASNFRTDTNAFVQTLIAPTVTAPDQRLALYRFGYALAMADLNLDENEGRLLTALKGALSLITLDCSQVEKEVMAEFRILHQATSAAVLGLLVVSADGAVKDDEVQNVQSQRALLEPIGQLDERQFGLVFDLGLNVHDRFLLDPANRKAFLENILAEMLVHPQTRVQAFEYAAAVATADGDIATAELDVLKELLAALQIGDAAGESVFNKYMTRVRTVDGKPR